jgi:predicted ATPase/transcriptional regulator with XRE-family HTH domain
MPTHARHDLFAELLRRHRLAAGLTQASLAEQAGLSARGIQNLERAIARPYRSTARRLADALGLAGDERDSFDAAATPAPRRRHRDAALGERWPEPWPGPPANVGGPDEPAGGSDMPPHNLPTMLSSFVGRHREIGDVRRYLGTARLVTLVGVGGCGKTRLAIESASELVAELADGIWFVPLAPISDPEHVCSTIVTALGLRDTSTGDDETHLITWLQRRQLLLVLDNFEHVLRSSPLVTRLLACCPSLKVLVTSRSPLGIPGERRLVIEPLKVPDLQSPPTTGALRDCPAVRLFLDRTRDIRPDFDLTPENARNVAELCVRLDGIPLAIELAATWIRVLSPGQILDRLSDRFRLLTRGNPGADPRQQTLRATLDWSFALLPDRERETLRRLSVFAGGWTLEAAEEVAADRGADPGQVLYLLSSLVDRSLVTVGEGPDGLPRYSLLETIREYAGEQLREAGESIMALSRHREYFLRLIERAEPALKERGEVTWLARLEAEHDNLRAALADCRDDPRGVEAGLRFVGAMWPFWFARAHQAEGRRWAEAFLASPGEVSPAVRAKALLRSGYLLFNLGEDRRAESLFQESLEAYRALGDRPNVADALRGLGLIAQSRCQDERARLHFEESLAVCRSLGDQNGIAWSLTFLGRTAMRLGDHGRAEAVLEEALSVWQVVGRRMGIAAARCSLGLVARLRGDFRQARLHAEAALSLYTDLGDRLGASNALRLIGQLALNAGDPAVAVDSLVRSLVLHRDLGSTLGLAEAFESLASATAACRQPERAARLLGVAATLRAGTGSVPTPTDRSEILRLEAQLRQALGGPGFRAARRSGELLDSDAAIEYALQGQAPAEIPSPTEQCSSGGPGGRTTGAGGVSAKLGTPLRCLDLA